MSISSPELFAFSLSPTGLSAAAEVSSDLAAASEAPRLSFIGAGRATETSDGRGP